MQRQFVVAEWSPDENDPVHLSIQTESEVSDRFDQSDFSGDAFTVWTLNKNADGFSEVTMSGNRNRIQTDEEFPFRFATTDLRTAEGTLVGEVVWTDH